MAPNADSGTRPVTGIVLLDKPSGITSNRALQRTKRLFRAAKAGHTGTLDPLATGMLPICLGAATKVSGLMLAATKRYRVGARFGIATDTGDVMGTEIECRDGPTIDAPALTAAARGMLGSIEQVPPMYSAVKHQGKRLYELARAGADVPRRARTIQVLEIEVETLAWPDFSLNVLCSKGTYVRTLIGDLAGSLGQVAQVTALRRLSVGPYTESGMVTLEALERAAEEGLEALDRWVLGADSALVDRPAVTVSRAQAAQLRNGCRVAVCEMADNGDSVRIYAAGGGFVGLGELGASGELVPRKIFPA